MFLSLDEKVTTIARFGDNRKVSINGKENMLIKACNGDYLIISDVYYMPDLDCNLFSIDQFQE